MSKADELLAALRKIVDDLAVRNEMRPDGSFTSSAEFGFMIKFSELDALLTINESNDDLPSEWNHS